MQTGVEILELIPQRPPVVLVDRFRGIDGEGVSHTEFVVAPACLFLEEGRLTECGLIEHMAQSAAARAGWLARQQGRDVALGYIGSVGRFRVAAFPPAGSRLETTIRVVQEVFNVSLVKATTCVDGEVAAEGELKIFSDDAAE